MTHLQTELTNTNGKHAPTIKPDTVASVSCGVNTRQRKRWSITLPDRQLLSRRSHWHRYCGASSVIATASRFACVAARSSLPASRTTVTSWADALLSTRAFSFINALTLLSAAGVGIPLINNVLLRCAVEGLYRGFYRAINRRAAYACGKCGGQGLHA